MAGLPWFELDVDMPDDPKCKALGARLKNPLAFAYVVRLYAYCYRQRTDGFGVIGARETVEDAAGWRGKPGVLFEALAAEGFLDVEPERVAVHGVAARLGPHLAKLDADRERARQRRAAAAASIGNPPGVAETSARHLREVRRDRDRDKDRDLSDERNCATPDRFRDHGGCRGEAP